MFKTESTPLVPALLPQDRARILELFAARITPGAGLRDASTLDLTRLPSTNIPHPFLRQALLGDPATSALLSCSTVCLGLGSTADVPFRITRSGVVMLPAALLALPRALAAAARWGLELVHLLAAAGQDSKHLSAALSAAFHYGTLLIQDLNEMEQRIILNRLPDLLQRTVLEQEPCFGPDEITWFIGLVDGFTSLTPLQLVGIQDHAVRHAIAERLCAPIEQVLVGGGDSRLTVSAETGLNRYGTAPRPRPEAVHFSSSTASSISDYGFTICEWVRQKLLQRILFSEADPGALRHAYRDSVERELQALLDIEGEGADVIIAPSGTDTELLAVLLALAADNRPLTNILIAPEETGRGVAFAGMGQYFDDTSATGAPIRKGQAVWPEREIATHSVPVRGRRGEIRPANQIHVDIDEQVRIAVAKGHRVLLHVLIGSKTGISAPEIDFVDTLTAEHNGRIDVVVDACQFRAPIEMLGSLVRKGWMLQISGSKFLTGPPFSGGLVVPAAFRTRRDHAAQLLEEAPGVGAAEDWSPRWWTELPQKESRRASFGPLLRWTAALAEARLLQAAPPALCRSAFDRFRIALERRLDRSDYLEPVDPPESADIRQNQALPGLGARSIVCFAVSRLGPDGQRTRLNMLDCQRVFELLNLDLSERIPDLDPFDRTLVKQPAHIGQPVELRPDGSGSTAVLRLVIGARFFTTIGFAGSNASEAALESEIADAIRALDKLEMIIRHLDRF